MIAIKNQHGTEFSPKCWIWLIKHFLTWKIEALNSDKTLPLSQIKKQLVLDTMIYYSKLPQCCPHFENTQHTLYIHHTIYIPHNTPNTTHHTHNIHTQHSTDTQHAHTHTLIRLSDIFWMTSSYLYCPLQYSSSWERLKGGRPSVNSSTITHLVKPRGGSI